MSKFNLKDLKIEIPKDFIGNPTDLDVVEWLEFRFGARNDIRLSNPLHEVELNDCQISVGRAMIDGKPFLF